MWPYTKIYAYQSSLHPIIHQSLVLSRIFMIFTIFCLQMILWSNLILNCRYIMLGSMCVCVCICVSLRKSSIVCLDMDSLDISQFFINFHFILQYHRIIHLTLFINEMYWDLFFNIGTYYRKGWRKKRLSSNCLHFSVTTDEHVP